MLRDRKAYAVFGFAVLFLMLSSSAFGQMYSGQATAIKSRLLSGVTPGVTTAVSDTGPLPSAGGSINLASASANVAGVLTARASTVSTSGSGNLSQSSASVEGLDVNVAGFVNDVRVRADTIASATSCSCPMAACTGGSTIANLRVGTRGGGTVITATGQANQTVLITVGVVTLTIVINEQIVSPASITVNALHITLTNSLTGETADVIVASSHSDITCLVPPPNDKYSGRATGVRLQVNTLIPPSSVSTIVSDTGPLPSSGGNITAATASTALPGVLSTGVVTSNTSGAGDISESDATVNNLSVSLIGAVTIAATVIQSETQCQCGVTPPVSCTGGSTVANLAVSVAGVPLAINVTGAPNQVVVLPLGLGSIVINEQLSAGPGDITVNALHVRLTPLGLASTDLVIAHSHSDLICSLAPTAGGVTVSGRVLTADGQPVMGAMVSLMGPDGQVWSGLSNGFGYYVVDDVPSGTTYMATVRSRRLTFPSHTITVRDNLTDVDFVADP